MRLSSTVLAFAAAASSAQAAYKGFNYGAFFLNQAAVKQADFEYEFKRARNLPNANGWTSARLYSMVQWGTKDDVIQAIPAAINTQTDLLLGLWISGDKSAIDNEISALKKAIGQYDKSLASRVIGISVGSEDLYRDAAPKEIGTSPAYLISCIDKVRAALKGTALEKTPIGHVDTYDSFFNATNAAVIDKIDWIGFDGYPFWESARSNSIDEAKALFDDGYKKTVNISKGKPVWVTETGWPVAASKPQNKAVASAKNAGKYWKDVACSLVKANVNVFWYDLQESQWGTADPDFGIYGAGDLNALQPRFDLAC